MERPQFFACYPADFANDIHVEAMTTLQVGAYWLLLCKAWQADPPASLPNDDQILARLARVDAAVWAEIRAGVLVPFRLGIDGRLHSKRLRAEYDTALRLIRAKKEAGSAGARKRWDSKRVNGRPNGSAMADPMAAQCGGNAIQIEIEKKNKDKKTFSADQAAESKPAAKKTPEKKPRQPDPLFDSIAEVTGSDPTTAGGHVAKVRHALAAAGYTPDDVRSFGARFLELCPWARGERTRPELGELQKHIGKLRALPPPAAAPQPPPKRPTFDW